MQHASRMRAAACIESGSCMREKILEHYLAGFSQSLRRSCCKEHCYWIHKHPSKIEGIDSLTSVHNSR